MTAEGSCRYLCNPDVVLREEDEDGGLLFNPDTNQVKVINASGLFIWKKISERCPVSAITSAMMQEFEEVPHESVDGDIREFIDELVQSGFLGSER